MTRVLVFEKKKMLEVALVHDLDRLPMKHAHKQLNQR